ncbi:MULTISPECIES: hypothetical protein [Pseudoalteromonas]|uniref:Uncharacterized protein n=1 Tax=Pseudoalteromonas maricaloris TaxID=184924 RepID=A0ABZ0MHJ6_9GAMM|nr:MULTISPECIES: hypothetical protein [Pseudoalteromonas]WOX31318.1 hypothetical protein R5H13_20485 [Pseudoalteromonas maricaloris]
MGKQRKVCRRPWTGAETRHEDNRPNTPSIKGGSPVSLLAVSCSTCLLSYLGQYGKCDIEVTNIIEGLNAVTVEYLHPCVDQQGNTDEKENKQKLMTLFEFSGEKIKRIRHYF